MVLRLFDTARGEVRTLEPRDPGKVSIYACGPTVYGPPHLGHGRNTLAYDILRRYLEWSGFDVTFVSNITDIEDKIIQKANDEGVPWQDVVAENEAIWYSVMGTLGCRRPDHDPHATAYVEDMVALIGRLVDGGSAYVIEGDGVYLDTASVDGYGLLVGQPLESLRAGARIEALEAKRSPFDFVLWKFAKPGEPSWPAPWADGRPGWHTECVVMSLDLLGEGFDIHGGGLDLRFPHHENERAQAVADGKVFASLWFHNGMLEIDGEKMSKSLGNVRNLVDLIAEYDPRAFRLLVLRSHYRTPMDVSDTAMRDASAAMERLDSLARRSTAVAVAPDADALDRFRALMDDDLSTPGAVALLFELVTRANTGDDPAAAAALDIAGALGLVLDAGSAEIDPEAQALAGRRDDARRAKDFATSDALRDELVALGYEVADTPEGTQLRRKSQAG